MGAKYVEEKQMRSADVNAQTIALRPGARVVRHGQRGAGVYTVVDGLVKLVLHGPRSGGRVLAFVGPGESFGEASALLDRRSPIDAVTLVDSVLTRMPARSIRTRMERDGRFAAELARRIAKRELDLVAEVEAIALHPARARLASYLLTVASPSAGGGQEARLPCTKSLVASRLGMRKETLSRLLHDLAVRRWISVEPTKIVILEPGQLARLTGGSNPHPDR